jgi:hypothetical protein
MEIENSFIYCGICDLKVTSITNIESKIQF